MKFILLSRLFVWNEYLDQLVCGSKILGNHWWGDKNILNVLCVIFRWSSFVDWCVHATFTREETRANVFCISLTYFIFLKINP